MILIQHLHVLILFSIDTQRMASRDLSATTESQGAGSIEGSQYVLVFTASVRQVVPILSQQIDAESDIKGSKQQALY